MFSKVDLLHAQTKSTRVDPTETQLERILKPNTARIRKRIEQTQRRVASEHILIQILLTVGINHNYTYEEVEWACRRKLISTGNALDLVSPGSYGKCFVGAFIPKQTELISLVTKPIDPNLPFGQYQPAKYLMHEYTNLNWDIGTREKPRGISFIEINLVELVWQYVKAIKYYKRLPLDNEGANIINLPVYIYRHVVYRMLPSYMELATFNRHRYLSYGLSIPLDAYISEYPAPRDVATLTDKNTKYVYNALINSNPLPAVVLNHIPLYYNDITNVRETCIKLIQFPNDYLTEQHRWFYKVINIILLDYVYQYDNYNMSKYYSTVEHDILALMRSNVLKRQSEPVYNHLMDKYISPLYDFVCTSNRTINS